MSHNKNWTAKDERILTRLFKAGVPYSEIGNRLHRTEDAVKVRTSVLHTRGWLDMRPREQRGRHKNPVRCLETGEEWDSILECATAVGCSASCIGDHIRSGEPYKGHNYELINN